MNFLQLCQRLASEVGMAGSGPASTTGQTGMNLRLVNWVNAAWLEIQQRHDTWKFMRGSFTVNTVADDGAYSSGDCTDTATSVAIANFRSWHTDTFKSYLQASGVGAEIPLTYIDYSDWYRRFNTATQTSGVPAYFTVGNSSEFLLGPEPSAVYVVSGEFQHCATELSGNSDTPELPAEYHMAIVYQAMMKYGAYAGAPEVYDRGLQDGRAMLRQMERTQLPAFTMAGPMA